MKKLIAIIALLFATTASASYLGTLVSQRYSTSITGRVVWICTYAVAGQYADVVIPADRTCPVSMEFN